MYIVKWILLGMVFCTSSAIGILISKKYSNRLYILKNLKSGLSIFEVKINFSCETIPEIFKEISQKVKGVAGKIFEDTIEIIKNNEINVIGDAWDKSLEKNSENLKREDIESLRTLGKLLGKTDIEGQISQIKLVIEFLDKQIQEAIEEKNKNEKMYQKLGMVIGIAIVIVLI